MVRNPLKSLMLTYLNMKNLDKKGGGTSLDLGKEQIILLGNKILSGEIKNRLNFKEIGSLYKSLS